METVARAIGFLIRGVTPLPLRRRALSCQGNSFANRNTGVIGLTSFEGSIRIPPKLK